MALTRVPNKQEEIIHKALYRFFPKADDMVEIAKHLTFEEWHSHDRYTETYTLTYRDTMVWSLTVPPAVSIFAWMNNETLTDIAIRLKLVMEHYRGNDTGRAGKA